MTTATKSVKAVVVEAPNRIGITTRATPRLRPEYILVKTVAVALNPTDWQHVYEGIGGDPSGTLAGCDYVGIVEEVGNKVNKEFKKGDRIAGFAHGSNHVQPEDGAFAEYIVVKGDHQIKVPDNISNDGAATLGVGVATVGQALYQSLKLVLPNKPLSTPEAILIYGGSTATGSLAIQFAKASGYRVLTTASSRHAEYLRSLGAEQVFDYNSPTWAQEVKAATGEQLKFAFDCIGTAHTARPVGLSMAAEGARYTTTEEPGAELIRAEYPNISAEAILAYTSHGEEFVYGTPDNPIISPARPEDAAFSYMFLEIARELLANGQVKPVKTTVNLGAKGFEGVLFGLEELRQGKVRGGKLVYFV